jgi:hypothetical protein
MKQMNVKVNDACEITNEANKLILGKVLEQIIRRPLISNKTGHVRLT